MANKENIIGKSMGKMERKMQPGIHDVSNDDYHRGPGISKSGLWKLWNNTPAHYFASRMGETDESSAAKDFGSAAHAAVLEPEVFESRYYQGPDARGNSNIWKDAAAYAAQHGLTILKPADYEAVLRLRDKAAAHPILRTLTTGAVVEKAAYWIDEETGELCRCKPDIYAPKAGLIGDIKTTTNAAQDKWIRRVMDFGYHVQEPFYTDGWQAAGGGGVEGFVFVVIESEAPHLFAVYELDPDSVEEGRRTYRAALNLYAECMKKQRALNEESADAVAKCWPGYSEKVTELRLPKWAFHFVNQNTGE